MPTWLEMHLGFSPVAQPGVNAGPKTASRRNARKRASGCNRDRALTIPPRAVYGPCPPQAVLGPTFTSGYADRHNSRPIPSPVRPVHGPPLSCRPCHVPRSKTNVCADDQEPRERG